MLSDSGRDSRQFPPDAIPLARRDKPDEGITAGERSSASGPGIGQVIIALCVVLLVIVGLARIVLGKGMHLPGGLPRDVVDVLGRRMVDGKNSLVLVRLGGKLLLLSSSPGGLSAVTEVTDPIEVASLTTLTKAAQDAPASNFRTVLGRFLSPRHSQSAPVGSFAERLRAVLPTAPEPLPISEVESNRFSRQGERA